MPDMRLARMDLATKVRATLLVCGAGLLLIALAYWRASAGTEEAARTFALHQAHAAQAGALGREVSEARRLQTVYAASLTDADRQALQAARQRLGAALDALQHSALHPEAEARLGEVQARVAEFADAIDSLNARVDEMGSGQAGLLAQLEAAGSALESAVEDTGNPLLAGHVQGIRRHEARFLLGGDPAHADRASEEKLPFDLALRASRVPAEAREDIRARMDAYQAALLAYVAARVGLDVEAQWLESVAASIMPALEQLDQAQAHALEAAREGQRARAAWMAALFVLTLILVSGVLVAALLMVFKAVRQPIEDTLRFAAAIADDRLDAPLAIHNPHDEIGRLARMLDHMRHRLRERIEAERAVARENERARQVLDSAQTGLMVLDHEGCVGYANTALRDVLQRQDSDALIGVQAIDLHPVFARIARRLAAGEHRFEEEVEHHRICYRLAVSAISVEGQYIGAAVEWRSRAVEMTVEHEIAAIVDAAAHGELQRRIALDGKDGFVAALAVSINRLLDTFQDKLAALQTLLEALSRGDLTRRVEGRFHGMFASMRDDADLTVARLTGIVSRIQEASTSITGAASEIAAGNADLSLRTAAQAASLEEITASARHLAEAVHRNIESARQADRLAGGAATVAVRGGQAVTRVVATMREIEQASVKIGQIVSVMDGIAFQTNILALNAAVEAARAGVHGRGFAVVAAEVRALSLRSAEAAREVKSLIDASVDKVGSGSRLADEAGVTMDELLDAVQQVAGIMGRILVASEEQGEGIGQVNRAIVHLDDATRRNAALVKHAAAAAGSMQEQAKALAASTAVFRTAGTCGPVVDVPQERAVA